MEGCVTDLFICMTGHGTISEVDIHTSLDLVTQYEVMTVVTYICPRDIQV